MKFYFSIVLLLSILAFQFQAYAKKAPSEKFAVGQKAMVVSASPLASEAGLEILRKGGNAFDAAAAVAFALTVVEPFGSSIGGDGICLAYKKQDDSKLIYSYRCRSSFKASYKVLDYSDRDSWRKTAKIIAVPGMVSGTCLMQEELGVLTLKEVLAPAIRFAEEGFEVQKTLAAVIQDMYPVVSMREACGELFLEDGFPPEVGAKLYNPDLAKTLRMLGENGSEEFYQGEVADRIVTWMEQNNGLISKKDFSSYKTIKSKPIEIEYRDLKVYSAPPPFGGIAVLGNLKMLEHLSLNFESSLYDANNIHALTEVMKFTDRDRRDNVGDPAFTHVPVNWILSDEYAMLRLRDFSEKKAISPGSVTKGPKLRVTQAGSTTHLSVMDEQGNAVAITQTLGSFFGSGIVVPGTGIVFNDQMKNFSRSKTSPNNLQPGKSMRSTQSPTMVFDKNKDLRMVIGSPGNYRIITTVLLIIVNFFDFNMSLWEAVDAPRFTSSPLYKELRMEQRFSDEIVADLLSLGHLVEYYRPYELFFGGVHAIVKDPKTGELTGVADPRRDGIAKGY